MKSHLIPNYEEAKALYVSGTSLTQIEKQLKINRKKLSKLLKEDSLDIRLNNQKYNYNDTFFDAIDNESKAYWLGFLYADGNVDNFATWEIRLGLAYKDKHHMLKFRDTICPELKYREYITKLKGKEYPCVKLQVTNKKLVEALIDKGCIPSKSLILKFPTTEQVPLNLQHHFIRGYFDGDGYIYAKEKVSPRFNLLGTKLFLDAIHDVFENNLKDYTRTKLSRKQGTEILSFNKAGRNNIKNIFDYLYKDATIYLERKYDVFQKIITSMPS